MEVQDALLTLAEFSIALAGFTGVVVVFGNRAGGWHPLDRYRILIILWGSIGPAFFSLLPIGIGMLAISESGIWRLCSFLLAGYLVGAALTILPRGRQLDDESRSFISGIMYVVNISGLALCTAAQVFNTLGLWFRPGPAAYFLSLVFVLFVAAYVFARMVMMRPQQ